MKFTKLFTLIIFLFCYINSFSQNAGITSIGSATACPNTIITVPVYVFHSPLISAFSLTINYDMTVLSANGIFITNFNSALGGISNFIYNQSAKPNYPGIEQAKIGWGAGGNGTQLDTNASGIAKLFDIQFNYYGGTTSLTFDNSSQYGGNCEYADNNANILIDTPSAFYYISGVVTECGSRITNNYTDNIFSASNYPNPFSQTTTIYFNIPKSGFVNIDIFDIFGRNLLNVINNYFIQGKHEVSVNMANFADGFYFCKVRYFQKGKVLSRNFRMSIIKLKTG